MPTWMVLGGGGVFGCHLAQHLLANNQRVISVGRNPWPQAPWNLGIGDDDDFRYEQIHILHEPKRLQILIMDEKPDFIVNFAAQAYATSWQDADRYYETNLVALARLTEWLDVVPWKIRPWRFIQIGTSELYGSCDKPATEDCPLRPTSPYAVSKMAADLHLQTLKGFPAIILRPSNAYGEAQQLYRLIPRAIYSALSGVKFPLNGGGLAEKSYIHAEDLARAVVTVAEQGQIGQVYNCGPSFSISIRDLVDVIATRFGYPVSQIADIAPAREGEDSKYWLDSSRIAALGWKPKIELLEGIDRMISWTRRNLNMLQPPKEFVLRT